MPVFKIVAGVVCRFLIFFAELILAYAAQRTLKILGKILPLCTGSDSVIGISNCFIINIAANVTYVFHFLYSPLFFVYAFIITSIYEHFCDLVTYFSDFFK